MPSEKEIGVISERSAIFFYYSVRLGIKTLAREPTPHGKILLALFSDTE
jgi:hypothetical protein